MNATYTFSEQRNYVYRIWDVYSNCYWISPNGRRQWSKREQAKTAWNCARCWIRDENGKRLTWDDYENTSRGFVIHKFRLQRVK